mmetsp:Transcript_3269/g.7634  ORF Transcript_3269/g.7634 Transcript_3269/m.7634 type:complete len:259 (-) Transcript_3269:377-1153(-)
MFGVHRPPHGPSNAGRGHEAVFASVWISHGPGGNAGLGGAGERCLRIPGPKSCRSFPYRRTLGIPAEHGRLCFDECRAAARCLGCPSSSSGCLRCLCTDFCPCQSPHEDQRDVESRVHRQRFDVHCDRAHAAAEGTAYGARGGATARPAGSCWNPDLQPCRTLFLPPHHPANGGTAEVYQLHQMGLCFGVRSLLGHRSAWVLPLRHSCAALCCSKHRSRSSARAFAGPLVDEHRSSTGPGHQAYPEPGVGAFAPDRRH